LDFWSRNRVRDPRGAKTRDTLDRFEFLFVYFHALLGQLSGWEMSYGIEKVPARY
jgi:hypothetical protein